GGRLMAGVDNMSPASGVSDGTSGPYQGWTADVRAKLSTRKKKSKRGKRHFKRTPPISITSLTDMVTMLLVYLLKTFATNPIEVKDPSIEIPHSVCVPDSALKEGDTPVD